MASYLPQNLSPLSGITFSRSFPKLCPDPQCNLPWPTIPSLHTDNSVPVCFPDTLFLPEEKRRWFICRNFLEVAVNREITYQKIHRSQVTDFLSFLKQTGFLLLGRCRCWGALEQIPLTALSEVWPTLTGFKIFFLVCNGRVTIIAGLLLKLWSNERDGSSVPNAAMLLRSPERTLHWHLRHKHISSSFASYFGPSWWTTHPASMRCRAHTRVLPGLCLDSDIQPIWELKAATLFLPLSSTQTKTQLLLPCDSHEEHPESMGSVWGSFKPAAASEKNPFFIPATRLARK